MAKTADWKPATDRLPGKITRGTGRIEGQVGQKRIEARVVGGQPGQGIEISQTRLRMVVDPSDHRIENAAEELHPDAQGNSLISASTQAVGDSLELES